MLAIDSVQVIGIYFTVTMEQKDVFYKLLDEHIEKLNGKYKDKFCISQQVYDEIKTVLSLDKGEKCDSGSYFKFWCKKNWKRLVNFLLCIVIVLLLYYLICHIMCSIKFI